MIFMPESPTDETKFSLRFLIPLPANCIYGVLRKNRVSGSHFSGGLVCGNSLLLHIFAILRLNFSSKQYMNNCIQGADFESERILFIL